MGNRNAPSWVLYQPISVAWWLEIGHEDAISCLWFCLDVFGSNIYLFLLRKTWRSRPYKHRSAGCWRLKVPGKSWAARDVREAAKRSWKRAQKLCVRRAVPLGTPWYSLVPLGTPWHPKIQRLTLIFIMVIAMYWRDIHHILINSIQPRLSHTHTVNIYIYVYNIII